MNYKKENLKLLASARNIFGDIVSKAFVCNYDYSCHTDDENIILLNIECAKINSIDTEITNYPEIQLEFTNGKVVGFTNSESASIFTPDLLDYKTVCI